MSIFGISLEIILVICLSTVALINPNFTPVNLVEQSQAILVLHMSEEKDGQYKATVGEVFKGEFKDKTISLGFSDTSLKEQAEKIKGQFKGAENNIALLFIGNMDTSGKGESSQEGESLSAFLHINGTWAIFTRHGAVWEFKKEDVKMKEVWRGGTDMLLQCCRYVQSNPNAEVPTAANAEWGETKEVATLDDRINTIYPVAINPDSTKQQIFIAADFGDKLYEYDEDADEFVDLSESIGLQSRSKISTWADCNKDGKLDLVSWNGETVALYVRDEKGNLSAAKDIMKTDCLSLDVMAYTAAKDLGLVIGTNSGPLVVDVKTNEVKEVFSPTGELNNDLGVAGPCLIADLNSDGHLDVLHLYSAGSILYKGKGLGSWSAPELSSIKLGDAPNGAFTADFDADGHLDVVTYGQHDGGVGIYQNHGNFKFAHANGLSGETYNVGKGVHAGMLGDINNDGRQDFVVFYSDTSEEPRDPQIYFNRGFRSFGFAADLNLSETSMLYDAASGQQAGCWADLNNDGAQDVVLVDVNNSLGVVFRNNAQEDALCLNIAVPTNGEYVGPIKVTAYNDDRNLGTWNINQSSPGARFCAREAGEFKVQWQIPGMELQEETVVVEEGSKRFLLNTDQLQEIEP